MQNWVEMRVHGVSGTPPESALRTDHVVQVAGDDLSRVFRRTDAHGVPESEDTPQLVEAFHWGRHTAGAWRQGLWFLLVPFGLINAAQFTLLPLNGSAGRASHAVAGACLRLLGLVATLMLIATGCVITVDLLAVQLLGSAEGALLPNESSQQPTTLAKLASLGTTAWVVIALGVVTAVLLGLWGLGRRRGQHGVAPVASGAVVSNSSLSRATFYEGDPDARTLAFLHVAAGLGVIAYFGLSSTESSGAAAGADRVVVLGFLGALALVVLFLGDPENSARTSPGQASELRTAISGWVAVSALAIGLVLWSAAVLRVATSGVSPARPNVSADGLVQPVGLQASDVAVSGLLAPAGVAVVTLLVATIVLRLRVGSSAVGGNSEPAAFRPFVQGQTGAVLGAVGIFLAVGLSAMAAYLVQAVLNASTDSEDAAVAAGIQSPRPDLALALQMPRLLQRIAYAWGLATIVVAVGALALAGWLAISRVRRRVDVVGGFEALPGPPARGPDGEFDVWTRRISTAIALARLKNFLPGGLAFLAACGLVFSLALGLEEIWSSRSSVSCAPDPVPMLGWLSGYADPDCPGSEFVTWLGSTVLALLAARLFVIGRSAVLSPEKRRVASVVWDVVAFWPRAVHPFTPWPYSQRVVSDLVARIRHHLGARPAGGVVLTAHSQGSLVSFAALLWLSSDELERVGFLTYGSQLRIGFSRAFPGFVNYSVLRDTWEALGQRWINLFRDTDPIGGPVLSWKRTRDSQPPRKSCSFVSPSLEQDDGHDPVTGRRCCGPDWRLLDPLPPLQGDIQRGPFAELRKHSDYPYDSSAWTAAVRAVTPDAPVSRGRGVPRAASPAGDRRRCRRRPRRTAGR